MGPPPQEDRPVAAIGQVFRQGLVHARREQQPGQEDDRARTAAVRPVREALTLMPEARHGGREGYPPLRGGQGGA